MDDGGLPGHQAIPPDSSLPFQRTIPLSDTNSNNFVSDFLYENQNTFDILPKIPKTLSVSARRNAIWLKLCNFCDHNLLISFFFSLHKKNTIKRLTFEKCYGGIRLVFLTERVQSTTYDAT